MPLTPTEISIEVPSTTANLGPGFDCLGLALQLRNRWRLRLEEGSTPGRCRVVRTSGEGQAGLPTDQRHLFFSTWRELSRRGFGPDLFELLQREGLEAGLEAENSTPLARGLGSSAAVRVASSEAYRRLTGCTEMEAWQLAACLEGHPDNAAPAGLGGLVASFQDRGSPPRALHLELHECWSVVVAIPGFGLLTEEARGVLPRRYERPQALFNLGRMPFLTEGLRRGDPELVSLGCQDRLHQEYRAGLIPGFAEVLAAGRRAGAAAVFLSGAGPTVAAFVDQRVGADLPERVAQAMNSSFQSAGVQAAVHHLQVDRAGLTVAQELAAT